MENNLILKVEYTNKSSSYGSSRNFRIAKKSSSNSVFYCSQVPFPSCCGIAIIKDVSIGSDLTKDEFAEIMDLIKNHLKEEDNFSKIIYYTNSPCRMEKYLSKYDGVIYTEYFKNKRSGNILIGFEINLLENDILEKEDEDNGDDFDFELDAEENEDDE